YIYGTSNRGYLASNYFNCIKDNGVADKVTKKTYGVDDKVWVSGISNIGYMASYFCCIKNYGVVDKVERMVAYGMVADDGILFMTRIFD
nr:hypothetical protein [Tanacetum cinerariifolium]